MLTVSKTVTFDAAHLLTGHGGQCRNLHGHTYRVTVELGNVPPLEGQPEDMVMDFKELKTVLNEEIVMPSRALLPETAQQGPAGDGGLRQRDAGLRSNLSPVRGGCAAPENGKRKTENGTPLRSDG